MDIEEMKPQWQSAQEAINPGHRPSFRIKRRTSLQRLANRYRRITILAVIFVYIDLFQFVKLQSTPTWLVCVLVAILAACAIRSYTLMNRISSIDPTRMPVKEVYLHIMNCRKRHLTFAVFGMPCALLWIAALAYYNRFDTYFLYGALSGAIIGFPCGLLILHRFLKDYREALSE